MKHFIIVGTAGHIDHGKSALVKALTKTDPDRWAEEKRRGITIDLGFAHLGLDKNLRAGFVDVPGHERFIKNMLAGVSGIDMVLLVIAADESIKPQTREHFDICRLLNIARGLVVLTKSDLVEPDIVELVKLEVAEFLQGSFLEGAPIVTTSARTGIGLETLKETLRKMGAQVTPRNARQPFRLPLDRAFVMKGFGTVVTGTLISGSVNIGQEVEILPGSKKVRVRSIQVHNQEVSQAVAGQRTALNLVGVETGELTRGMVLVPPGTFRITRHMDCSLTLLDSARPVKPNSRVHLHLGTSEQVAEVIPFSGQPIRPGEKTFVQLRLTESTVAVLHDRFIIRQFSPLVTLGGGTVLDNQAFRHKRNEPELADYLRRIEEGSRVDCLLAFAEYRGLSTGQGMQERTGWSLHEIEDRVNTLRSSPQLWVASSAPPCFLHKRQRDTLVALILNGLENFHRDHPLLAGISKEELRSRTLASPQRIRGSADHLIFEALLQSLSEQKKIALEGETVRLASHRIVLTEEEARAKTMMNQAFSEAGLAVPTAKEVLGRVGIERPRAQAILQILLREQALVKIAEELFFHVSAVAELRQRLAEYKKNKGKISVGEFKELAGVSRKYAIPLLEYLDRERITRREGDLRVIL